MKIDDIFCPCGAPVEPVQDDAGVFLRCTEGCSAVTAPAAPSVKAAIDEWFASVPVPSPGEALDIYIHSSAAALATAQSTQSLIVLAPVAQVLISFLQLQSNRPAGD
ncbi:MAG: hypothetical protein GY838_13195 [bacterium]|nr:hypothetical protein [bacterium]